MKNHKKKQRPEPATVGIPDVIPFTMALYPKEIANRIHYWLNGTLIPMLFVRRNNCHIHIVPSATGNGVTYENHMIGRHK